MSTAPTTPLSHIAYLTEQIRIYHNYLGHSDPSVRLMGLRAIQENMATLVRQEVAASQITLFPRQEAARAV